MGQLYIARWLRIIAAILVNMVCSSYQILIISQRLCSSSDTQVCAVVGYCDAVLQ